MSENTNAANQINNWFKNAKQKVTLVRSSVRDLDSMKMLHLDEGSYLGEIVGTYSKIKNSMTLFVFQLKLLVC